MLTVWAVKEGGLMVLAAEAFGIWAALGFAAKTETEAALERRAEPEVLEHQPWAIL